jgi:hypothetical protein
VPAESTADSLYVPPLSTAAMMKERDFIAGSPGVVKALLKSKLLLMSL